MKSIIKLLILINILLISEVGYCDPVTEFTRIKWVSPSPDATKVAIISAKLMKTNSIWQWQNTLSILGDKKIATITNAKEIELAYWSPDQKYLSYMTKENGTSQLWLHKMANDQTFSLLKFAGDISSYRWSPLSNYIAFTGTPTPLPISPNLPYDIKDRANNINLYLLPVAFNPKPFQVTHDLSISLGFNDLGFDWSPDQRTIAFAYQPESGAEYGVKSRIQFLDIKTHQLKSTDYFNKYYANQPAYSPDGKYLAFRSNAATENIDTDLKNNIFYSNKICVMNLTTHDTHCLADTPNANPSIIGWNIDNENLFALDFYKSIGAQIYSMNLNEKISPTLLSNIDGFIEPLTIHLNSTHTTFGFGYENINKPPEAYIASASAFHPIRMTEFNKTIIAPKFNTEDIDWRSLDGKKIEGLLMTPPNYKGQHKHPLLVWIHGGPMGAAWKRYLGGCDEYGDSADPSSCWINYLKQGFIVFAPNYRGSTGYGADFRFANYRDFGGQDFQDIESGVDYLIAKNIVDPNLLAIAGWSYGGYMTSWAIGQTNRYKAAIEGDGLTDLISFSGTSDIPYYTSVYLGTLFWNDNFLYQKRSPITYVKNISTPLLIFNGQKDLRVPIEQAYQMYTALRLLNKPVKMYVYPNQGHVPTNANMLLTSQNIIHQWLAPLLSNKAAHAKITQ